MGNNQRDNMAEKKEYKFKCTEEQARKLISILSEDDRSIMIKNMGIHSRDSLSTDGLIDYSKYADKSFPKEKGHFYDYLKSVKSLQEKSEKSKVMPLTNIRINSYSQEIENDHLYCMDNKEISRLYNELTDISKLLNGWRVDFIGIKDIELKRDIVRVKKLVSNLSEDYSLSFFRVLLHPWIRTGDHYSDYLESDAELSFSKGILEIESEEEIFKVKKKLGLEENLLVEK